MATQKKTGFDKYFEARMQDPGFRQAYEEAELERLAIDKLLAVLDQHRVQLGMSKAELAELAQMRPEMVRRLFTTKGNPTLATVVKIVQALGCEIRIEVKSPRASVRSSKLKRASATL